ncbi:hypothetical protein LQK65_003208 [Vibrio parahaemolyticus]|nr:hypothetical protein [Vibrio parahaemolyticus]
MNWDDVPSVIKERYENISKIDDGRMKVAFLEEMNKQPIALCPGVDSLSYEIFANEFNSIMLTAHIFENLMIFEDRWHERVGYNDFQIKIPEVYFQHPSFNDDPKIKEEDASVISEVLDKIKKKLNYSKDASYVLSNLYKMEFISVFSHLEAYIESLHIEFLGMEKKEAAAKVRQSALPKLIEEVFCKIDPRIIETINCFDDEALKFIEFCHKLRNLHTHNLGIVTKYFYNESLEKGYLIHDVYSETSEPVLNYARLNFKYSDYILEVGRTVNLWAISQPFRLLSREIVYISEVFCKEKHNKQFKSDS